MTDEDTGLLFLSATVLLWIYFLVYPSINQTKANTQTPKDKKD